MISIGLFASVDSGKTTLSEAILYNRGVLRKLGRVDHKTAFLDSNAMEKLRGITIFLKCANFEIEEREYTLLDTPGHRDFGPEMEKAMAVSDYGILVVSAPDLIKERTKEIFTVLRKYRLPIFVFVNKMDRALISREEIIGRLRNELSGCITDFENEDEEEIASLDDRLTEDYLSGKPQDKAKVRDAIMKGNIIPAVFGSALKNEGVDKLVSLIYDFAEEKEYGVEPEAISFKTLRDEKGKKIVFVRITGGKIKTKEYIKTGLGLEQIQEIRKYQGENYEALREAKAGEIVGLVGIQGEIAGENDFVIRPERRLRVELPSGMDAILGFKKLRELGEENPSLEMEFDEIRNEIHISTMGELELDILKQIANKRFNMEIGFGEVGKLPETEIIEEEKEEERNLQIEEFELSGNDEKDLERIFKKTFGESKRDDEILRRNQAKASRKKSKEVDNFPKPNWKEAEGKFPSHLIIDGYNALFSWDELKELIAINIDSARDVFIDTLMNYQGYRRVGITVIFDGYKVKGGTGSTEKHGDIEVVYTKERETADRYIEKLIYDEGKKYDYTVVTSDLPVQMASFGDGAKRMSSREFYSEVMSTNEEIREKLRKQVKEKNNRIRLE